MNLLNVAQNRRRFEVEIVMANGGLSGTFVNVRPPLYLFSAGRKWVRKPSWSTLHGTGVITITAHYREVRNEAE